MKKFLNILAAMLLAVVSTSCLDSNLEELDLYSGCDVTNGNINYAIWLVFVPSGAVKGVRANLIDRAWDFNVL